MRVVRPWPRLPREAVVARSLAVLKARLDGALSTLGWWKGSLPVVGWMIFKVPSNPSHFVIQGVPAEPDPEVEHPSHEDVHALVSLCPFISLEAGLFLPAR